MFIHYAVFNDHLHLPTVAILDSIKDSDEKYDPYQNVCLNKIVSTEKKDTLRCVLFSFLHNPKVIQKKIVPWLPVSP